MLKYMTFQASMGGENANFGGFYPYFTEGRGLQCPPPGPSAAFLLDLLGLAGSVVSYRCHNVSFTTYSYFRLTHNVLPGFCQ